MSMAERIKILLIKRNMTLKELSEALNSTPSNVSNKLKRDNFPENELKDIAQVLNCTFEAGFKLNDTGEKI